MPIKPFVEDLDSVEEPLRELYVEIDGGGFALDTDVTQHPSAQALKRALDEERTKGKKAAAELKKFQGVDLDRWASLSDLPEEELKAFQQWRETRDKGSPGKDKDDFEEQLTRATGRMRSEFDKELKARDERITELDTERTRLDTDLRTYKINHALMEVATKKGARNPTDILLRANGVWGMDDNGEPAAFSDGDLIRGRDGVAKITMEEWVEGISSEAPYLFKASVGGGAGGANNGNGSGPRVQSKAELRTTQQKVAFIREHGQEAFEDLPPGTSSG